ncbi:unnamed protein product [Symbiodinium natans]|uniref:Uncharacterized protein n=1 Tax=Symbiodinium natans TaxID=878477 RepID=A0A812UYZ6_9DINO|nr:unnamed protein product [Symbiodinium natans]
MAPQPRKCLLRPRVGALLLLCGHVAADRDHSWSSAEVEAFEDASLMRIQLLQLQFDLEKAPNDQDPSIVVVPPRPHKFPADETIRIEEQAVIPTSAFLLGAVLLVTGHRMPGMLATYFAGQSSFALYMKLVLSEETVSRELKLERMPAAFLVTAIQRSWLSCPLVWEWPCCILALPLHFPGLSKLRSYLRSFSFPQP